MSEETTSFVSITSKFQKWIIDFQHNAEISVRRLAIRDYIRLIAIVGAYCLLRPYLMKLGGKFQTSDHERPLDPNEMSSPAAVSPNTLREQIDIPEDSDSEDEGTVSGSNWGKSARRKQRHMVRQIVEAEEKLTTTEVEEEDEETASDKEIEEFLQRVIKYHSPSDMMSEPPSLHPDYNASPWYHRVAPFSAFDRRSRRWPPGPRVEDEAVSLSHEHKPILSDTTSDEASMRGDTDQLPIILEAFSSIDTESPAEESESDAASFDTESSNESIEPYTPPESINGNQDRRYVYIPEKGIEIPLTYDEPRIEKKAPPNDGERGRSRKDAPKLDTEFVRQIPSENVPSPLERERSPYSSHAPKPTKPSANRVSGEFLLSPDLLSPNPKSPDSRQSRGITGSATDSRSKPLTQAASLGQPPTRPINYRSVSAMAVPTATISTRGARSRSRHHEFSSDDSEDNFHGFPRVQKTRIPHNNPAKYPREHAPKFEEPFHHREKKFDSSKKEVLPSMRTLSACDNRALPAHVLLATGLGIGLQSANSMTPNSPVGSRRASPRCSPSNTPHASPSCTPPGTPPASANHRKDPFNVSTRKTLPFASTSSPLQPPHSAKSTSSTSRPPSLRSRQTSPLPSTRREESEPGHGPRIDIRAPSPANHQKNSSYEADGVQLSSIRHPSLIPFVLPRPPTLQPPSLGARRRASSHTGNRPTLKLDPLPSYKAFELPQSPATGPRPLIPNRAVSVGSLPAALPRCPRPNYIAGYNDWYTLVGCPTFAICPTCREAVLTPGYAHNFIPRVPKPKGHKTRCDFSIPWMRMAWLLTLKQKRSDVNLLYAMAEVAAHEPSCPGKSPAVREWYQIDDTETGRHISNFNACSYCVRNIETIFPALRGVFHRPRSTMRHSMHERPCSLRFDSQRFAAYVDLLEETANQASQYRRSPNMLRFVDLARRMVAIRECSRDDMLLGQMWHVIPHLPEFTVCEECYDDVVCPAIRLGSPLASQFSRNPQIVAPAHVGISCQLYSPRMRKIFQEACAQNDFGHLRNSAVQRYRVEKDLQARHVGEGRSENVKFLVEEWRKWE